MFFQSAQFSWVMCIKKSDWGPFGSILRCFHFSNQIKPKWFFGHIRHIKNRKNREKWVYFKLNLDVVNRQT